MTHLITYSSPTSTAPFDWWNRQSSGRDQSVLAVDNESDHGELHVTSSAKNIRMAEANGNPKGLSEITPERKATRHKNNLLNSKYILRKNEVLKVPKNGRDIYVNNRIPLKGYLRKCEKLFDKGASELIIHGLGAVVFKAVNLALRLKEIHHGTLDLDIKTSTVILKDNLTTLDGANCEINRQNSGIHIRVFRRVPFAVLRSKTN